MNPVLVAAWVIVAVLVTWFVVSCYYDMRQERIEKENAELRTSLALAEFKLSRRDVVKADFEKECG